MAARPERPLRLPRRRVPARSSFWALRAIGPIRAISTGGWIIRIGRSHAAARTVHSIAATDPAGAGAPGEIRDKLVVVAQWNVELCRADVGVAGHCDGDMGNLPVADSGIASQRHNAFLVDGHNARRDLEILPQNLPFSCAFRLQYFAVWLGYCRNQPRLLSRSDSRAFRLAGFDGHDGSLLQVDPHPQPDLNGGTPAQRHQ